MIRAALHRWGMTSLRYSYVILICLSVVPNGAQTDYAYFGSYALHALLFAVAAFVSIINPVTRRMVYAAILIAVVFAAYCIFQSVPLPNRLFANSVWQLISDQTIQPSWSISIEPWTTIAAIPAFVGPLMIFATGLILHQQDRAAQALWVRLALVGGVLASVALVRHQLFPNAVLFGTPARQDLSLTGNFYNRNNAAAFLGMVCFALFGIILMQLVRLDLRTLYKRIPSMTIFSDSATIRFVIYVIMLFFTMIALFLTRSRGGVSFSLTALALSVVIIILTLRGYRLGWKARAGIAFLALLVASGAFLVYGGRTIVRLDDEGFDEARWCAAKSTFQAIQDYPMFGTGFGTFRTIFPIYRNVECGIHGIWDRAHNTFLEGYLGLGFPFCLFLAILIWFIANGLIIGFCDRYRFKFISILTIGLIAYISMHSFVDFPLQIPGLAVYFSSLLSAGIAISIARRTVDR